MNQEYYLLIGALKTFNDFTENKTDISFTYDHSAPGFSQLLSKYPVQEVAGNGSELEKALNLMKWCSANVLHNGGTKDVEFIPKNSLEILNYAYKKGPEYGVYCRLQAIVFTECCLAVGLKSRILICLPYSPYDFESHVVSIVYITSMNKWIMLDAGNYRFFMDENDTILSPMEARERLANDDFIKCNMDEAHYKPYMAKNLFYFKSLQNNTFGSDLLDKQETIYCVPKGFDALGRELASCRHAIKNSPPHLAGDWKDYLEKCASKTSYINMSADAFFEGK